MSRKMNGYYEMTSPEQRKLLFKTWQKTGRVDAACKIAEVSRSTFYYWKKRFDEEGFQSLQETRSHAPKNPRRIDRSISNKIIELKRANPCWGKRQIAQNILQNDNAVKSLSPNTVRRVLIDENLW